MKLDKILTGVGTGILVISLGLTIHFYSVFPREFWFVKEVYSPRLLIEIIAPLLVGAITLFFGIRRLKRARRAT